MAHMAGTVVLCSVVPISGVVKTIISSLKGAVYGIISGSVTRIIKRDTRSLDPKPYTIPLLRRIPGV